jgi:heptaprenyl diphosphate synthase
MRSCPEYGALDIARGRESMDARDLSRVGVLSACAVAAYVFESFIPVPVPWARIGLSNVVVVIALFGLGTREALIVTLVRIVAGNLLLGILLSPAFMMSLAGSLAALAAMGLVRRHAVPPLSVVGASAVGAVASNAVQIYVFALLFTGGSPPPGLLGGFIIIGALVGFATGLFSVELLKKVTLERSTAVR